jgi:hypothetical protein
MGLWIKKLILLITLSSIFRIISSLIVRCKLTFLFSCFLRICTIAIWLIRILFLIGCLSFLMLWFQNIMNCSLFKNILMFFSHYTVSFQMISYYWFNWRNWTHWNSLISRFSIIWGKMIYSLNTLLPSWFIWRLRNKWISWS